MATHSFLHGAQHYDIKRSRNFHRPPWPEIQQLRLIYMDAGLYSCGVFIDLKKAFDTVDHIILLCKLSHHRIRGIINFALYLTDTTQTTQVGASISSKGEILFGVPQGFVLGTLLFLIFINGIYSVSSKLNFYLFADDANILYANNNLKSIESVVNEELREVC